MTADAPPAAPDPSLPPLFQAPGSDDRSTHAQRQLIGYLGAALPLVLPCVASRRPIPGLPTWLDSISAYYYTGAVAAFVGVLIALAAFLVTYRGYDNRNNWLDRTMAFVAAAAAACVAAFPTGAPGTLTEPPWWTGGIETFHYASAATLFGAFAVFCFVLFPKSAPGQPKPLDKRVRNAVFYLCGAGIVASLALVVVARRRSPDAAIFWQEAAALWFFAISWLVKGRVEHTAGAAVYRALHLPTVVRQMRSARRP